MPQLSTDRFRLVALMHPKEGVSYEEFSRYWLNEHSKLFKSLGVVQKNVTKYEQFHFNPTANAPLVMMGVHKLPYWGMAIFEAESYEKLMEVFTDKEYMEVCRPDEEKFFTPLLTELAVGDFAVFIDKKPTEVTN